MERLTKKDVVAGHEVYFVSSDDVFDVWSVPKKFMGEAIDRLAAYEDTGLMPDASAQLKQIAEIFNCDPNDPVQLKRLCDKLRDWQVADQDGRMRVTDVEGKCGSCLHYRRREDLPAFGCCLKQPYGRDVVHDPKYPYVTVQRTRPKCKKYEAAVKRGVTT